MRPDASSAILNGGAVASPPQRRAATALRVARSHRRLVSLAAYAVATSVAYLTAFLIHFDLIWRSGQDVPIAGALVVLLALRLSTAYACGLSTHRWRYVDTGDVRRLVLATAAGSFLFIPLAWDVILTPAIPARVLVLEPVFTVLLTAGLWLGYRTACETLGRARHESDPIRRVVIVGAGGAGEALVRQMVRQPAPCWPVALVDDDAARRGTSLHGVNVLGCTEDLPRVVERTRADEIAIAIPSAAPEDLRRIVEHCELTGLPYRILPGIRGVFDGKVSMAQLREVRIEDLLGREPVELEIPELAQDLAGASVLITGAAGSIGSELARQVARHRPSRLVLLDQSETGLFYLELELSGLGHDTELVPVVADVVDAAAMDWVFRAHRPSRVFHAAAYKHVPMLEVNAREGLRNNVIGTWRVAEAAGRYQAEKFVLISTDKAVRPVSVMGVTKRLAEMLVLELQEAFVHTTFGAVRFGNVLGSAGSVIPVFKRQIEQGKPLTVTHPEVTRYFMTIPEATQLVLQASMLPELRGQIAMLEMGKPVRILDLARTLMRLSGQSRGKQSIVFTGLRPGEKLHEELVAPGEDAGPTPIPKVWMLRPGTDLHHDVLSRLPEWERLLAEWRVERLLHELRGFFPELGLNGADPVRGHGAAPGRSPESRPRVAANVPDEDDLGGASTSHANHEPPGRASRRAAQG